MPLSWNHRLFLWVDIAVKESHIWYSYLLLMQLLVMPFSVFLTLDLVATQILSLAYFTGTNLFLHSSSPFPCSLAWFMACNNRFIHTLFLLHLPLCYCLLHQHFAGFLHPVQTKISTLNPILRVLYLLFSVLSAKVVFEMETNGS